MIMLVLLPWVVAADVIMIAMPKALLVESYTLTAAAAAAAAAAAPSTATCQLPECGLHYCIW